MRNVMLALSVWVLLSPTVCSQPQLTRDPQALSLLAGLRAAMGGNILAAVQDTVATAEVRSTRDGTTVVERLRIKTYGRDGVRIEANTAQGPTAFVMDARLASAPDASGAPKKYSRKSFGAIGAPHLPLLSILSDFADSKIKVEYVGLEKAASGSVHHIRIQKALDPADGLGDFDAPVEAYLDAATLLPSKIVHALRPPENLRSRVPMEIQLSDYRSFGGLVVPFKISYFIHNSLVSESTLLSFAVNQGAKPADFEVKP